MVALRCVLLCLISSWAVGQTVHMTSSQMIALEKHIKHVRAGESANLRQKPAGHHITVHTAGLGGGFAEPSEALYEDMKANPARNIALTNLWEMQFFGTIEIGTPPRKFVMVFDTGSGQMIVRGSKCNIMEPYKCQGSSTGDAGYSRTHSSSFKRSYAPFETSYGR